MKLVLASKSPRRREILGMVYKDFTVRVSDASEEYDGSMELIDVPQLLAERKAECVEISDDEIVIGCDTVVIHNGKLLGKPRDESEAIEMLESMSGTAHLVVSGICVRDKSTVVSDTVVTEVTMRPLEREEIERYVYTCHPTDKAGAYGIQEMAGAFVEGIRGDFYNVVGLPLCKLCCILKEKFGFNGD
ncbi:MAG: septum formation protein Maf [Clostridia bacterium]|nr:septum formation protein Maf [Clostridia bacterium]